MENATTTSTDMMTKHWLLNLAVEYPVWLGHVFPAVNCEALNVRPVPGCDARDYAGALLELSDSGMITLSSEVPGDDPAHKPGIERILDRFVKFEGRMPPFYQLNRVPGMQVNFRLTLRGGEAWESMAHPNWPHILRVSVDPESGNLLSPDRHLLMAYMGWYEEIEGQRIHPQAVTWQEHPDFQILYWKRLPLVYEASFVLMAAQAGSGHKWSGMPQWFREWYVSAISWHKQPWELQGWPS